MPWTRSACILMLVGVALSRLPFLDAGYGVNVDAWRVARAARHIAQTGEYEASRFPGYPVHEIVCSWFWTGGPAALNALSAAFSVAAVFATWLIGRRLKCRDSCLLALSFAFAPVFFVNSVTGKDYVWALGFLWWAFYAAIDRRPILSGLLLGFAVGCRVTSAAFLVPIAMILYGNEMARSKSVVSRFIACTAGTASLLFLPVWARYGWSFFTFYENHARPDVITVMHRATIEVWGTLGATGLLLALVAVVIFFRRSPHAALPEPANRLLIPAFVTMIILSLIAYLRLPDQAAYLIPMMPAFLFLMARFAPRRVFQLASVFLPGRIPAGCRRRHFATWRDYR